MRLARRRSRGTGIAIFVVLVSVLVAGCGGSNPTPAASPSSPSTAGLTVIPYVITSPAVVGPNRFLFSYLTKGQPPQPAAAPDRTAKVEFLPAGATAPVASADGRFVWGIENVAGIYVTNVDLPSAGEYVARFTTSVAGGEPEVADVSINVLDDVPGVGIGDRAPASDTPTLTDVGGDLRKISTDEHPVERFYTSSVADAVAAKEPFVLVFATPKFCTSQQCGPTLEHVKAVVNGYPDLTVINVEPYELKDDGGALQPVTSGNPPQLVTVPAVNEWGLQSEPWIFVVDGSGVVRGSFQAIIAEDELKASIDEVLAGS